MTPARVDRDDERDWPGSAHEATRFLLSQLPECSPVDSVQGGSESYGRSEEPPELLEPDLIEGSEFEAIPVADASSPRGESGFAAFLDGTQKVEVVGHDHGIPIVWAAVSAAIRARVDRRLVSWNGQKPIVRKRFYIPLRYVVALPEHIRLDSRVVDVAAADSKGKFPSRHPAALIEATIKRVQSDREKIEIELAEAWIRSETATLYVDGSIAGSDAVATSTNAVGVIKSHRRLYADGAAFNVLVQLAPGERTSIFEVTSNRRRSVASWYVRLRRSAGHDALFGLVRVEASITNDISTRADQISRWVMAEGAPLSLPDGRWDKMAYGIRDTEEFLRAIS